MKLIIISLALFVCLLEESQCAPNIDRIACVINYLKQRSLLDDSYPSARPSIDCSWLISMFLSGMEKITYKDFDNKESIKADCVKRKLGEKNFSDYNLKKQLIANTNDVSMEKLEQLTKETKADMKRILNEVSSECESDPNWAGLYDEYLSVENSSLAALQQNYCFLKNSLDKYLLTIENVNRNEKNIDTSKVDCDAIIQKRFDDMITDTLKLHREKNTPKAVSDCVIEKMHDRKYLNLKLALEVLEIIDIPFDVYRFNKQRLENNISDERAEFLLC